MEKEILASKNPESSGKTQISLDMFQPEALATGQLDKPRDHFFGRNAKWLGAYTGNNKYIEERENKKRKKFLANNPRISEVEYNKKRLKQIEEYRRKSRKKINYHYDAAVRDRFNLSENPRGFAIQQYVKTSDALAYLTRQTCPKNGKLRQANEISVPPVSPAHSIEIIASPITDPALRQQEINRHLLAHIAAEQDTGHSKFKANAKLAQIQNLLNHELFDPPIGATENIPVAAVYDDKTNEVGAIDVIDGRLYPRDIPPGHHIKTYDMPMRKTKKGTRVYIALDVKEFDASIIKGIRKTQETKEDGLVKAGEYVTDTHRILFTVDGGQKKVNAVARTISNLLNKQSNQKFLADLNEYDEPVTNAQGKYVGGVTKIKDDSRTNGFESQSKSVNWTRIQIYFEGIKNPIEVKFQSLRDFLRDEFEIGKKDPKTGLYDGAAHDLYCLRRAIKVAELLLPVDQLKTPDYSNTIIETQEEIVSRLRNTTKQAKAK